MAPRRAAARAALKLGGWGAKGLGPCELTALDEYERCFSQAATLHSMCEDCRASAGIDLDHDRASRADGQKVECDTLLLRGERGVIQTHFDPLKLWREQRRGAVSGHAIAWGHFIPEELPEATAQALRAFMRA